MTQPIPSASDASASSAPSTAAGTAPHERTVDMRSPYFFKLDHKAPALPTRPGTVILDIEDGVCTCDKAPRRKAIQAVLAQPMPAGVQVLVRCHGMDDAGGLLLDLDEVAHPAISGFILPMSSRVDEVEAFDDLLTNKEEELGLAKGHFPIHLLIELPEAYLDLADLARASSRIASVMFGREDFMTRFPTGGIKAADLAEARIPLVAAALGLPAIASPFCAVDDPKGFERYCRRTRELGYTGAFTVHPSQRPLADATYGPSALDVQSAKKLIEGSTGAQLVRMNGCLVGPPMRKRAQSLLDNAAAMDATTSASESSTVASSTGRFPRYGVDTSTTQVGSILESP
ncbi:MAG: aldolase/citrate lyase family protein, partial [Flavobacteriales bacterium]|nr:aldolase/citrate lyase family protein [Flavobacteriales bacterium]